MAGASLRSLLFLFVPVFLCPPVCGLDGQVLPGSVVSDSGDDAAVNDPGRDGYESQTAPASADRAPLEAFAPAESSAAVGRSETESKADDDCDLRVLPVRSDALHELILTTRQALAQNFSIRGTAGFAVFPLFQNQAEIPSLADVYGKQHIQRQESDLKRSGFSVPAAEHFVLLPLWSRDAKFLECGVCYSGSRYAFVTVASSGTTRRGRVFYNLVETDLASGTALVKSFVVYEDSLLVEGADAVRVGVRGILACIESGDMPFFVARPIGAFSQAPVFKPGPFREPVEVVMAEAIRGPSPSSATLKATLLPSLEWDGVAHVQPDVATVTLFANLPGPALAESAFALSALRRNPRCTLVRDSAFGPVRLECEAWVELKNRLDERSQARIFAQKVRAARGVAAKVIGAAALISVGLVLFGFRKDSRVGRAARKISGAESQEMSNYLREEYGISNSAVLRMATSMDPDNLTMAAESLSRRTSPVRRLLRTGDAAKALVLRGVGGYGLGGSAGAAAVVVPFFLLHKGYDVTKSAWKRARLQSHVANVVKGAASTTNASERRRRRLLFVVLP
ncbi:transmembrane protein [Cystoisospora suis]|uniref:Transmembrane protein n=1 Tax=Cystoisospora suis TaxID=483139 RepID=A0A2C6L119_9APIC|nr:transmembrane protein [Cystoisospora suis]